MKFVLIAAMDNNRVIGFENTIPWKVSCDMKWFKTTTTNNTVIMGRNTFESFGCKPLPNRINVVIGTSVLYHGYNILQFSNIEEFMIYVSNNMTIAWGNFFVIGGQQLYTTFITQYDDYIDSILLTHLDVNLPQGDTYFPILPDSYESLVIYQQIDVNKLTGNSINVVFKKYFKH